jgi:hypothetical protein
MTPTAPKPAPNNTADSVYRELIAQQEARAK